MKKEKPILSLCVPTYNREKDLEYNLSLLEKYINEWHLREKVQIFISNNHSTDDTKSVIDTYLDRLGIIYYEQDRNIGGLKNILFLVEHCDTDWVMLLGDDDYLEPWYIKECLKQIEKHPNLGCIIPNYMDYYPATGEYGHLREENCETQYYKAGFDACLQNAWRAHQLSGLCFRRENVVEEFRKRGMNNLYPQIFFVSYCALRYDVLHFGHFCLRVSVVPQNQKDWNYRNDGLMNDILQNFRYLNLSIKKRALLEAEFNKVSKRYYWVSGEERNIWIENILKADNLSCLGGYYISKQILREQCYTGKRYRWMFYLLARIILFKNLITGRTIGL